MVYDISKPSSFENIQKWLQELRDHADSNIAITLIGNKSDLKHLRAVKYEDGLKFAELHCMVFHLKMSIEIPFMETSALNASNVDTAFRNLVQEIYRLTISGKFDNGFLEGRQNQNQSTEQLDDDNDGKSGVSKGTKGKHRGGSNVGKKSLRLNQQTGYPDANKDAKAISTCCGGSQ